MNFTDKIKGFDGVRGLAAIFVVLTHLHFWDAAVDHGFITATMKPLLNGTTGVQAFFILSGFLITVLLIKEIETTGTISIRNFIARRSLRIFPLYILFCLLATGVVLAFDNVASWRSMFYLYLYAYNFVPTHDYSPFLGHTWSLAVEEHFYLLWPVLFFLLFRKQRKILVVSLVLFVVASLLLQTIFIKQGFATGYFVERWSFTAGYNIALGCLAALVLHGGTKAAFYRRVCQHPLVALVGFAMYANSLYFLPNSWFLENVVGGYIRSFGILLLLMWIYLNQNGIAVKVLEVQPLKYIGVISYGVYMWQGFFLGTGPNRLPGQYWPPDQYIGLVLLIVVAPVSYHYFEKPFLRLKKNYAAIPSSSMIPKSTRHTSLKTASKEPAVVLERSIEN